MKNCCNPIYQDTFDDKYAQDQLKNYLRKGVKKSSKPMVQAIKALPVDGKSLLDIGGGIGVMGYELFPRGLAQATLVDMSSAFIRVFKEESVKRSLTDKTAVFEGDFLQYHDQIMKVDLVTLDKVICCYDNYQELVQHSVSKARSWYVYSIPRNVWWVNLVHGLEEWYKRLRKNKFRTYIHSEEAIQKIVEAAGFTKIDQRFQREWVINVFEKR